MARRNRVLLLFALLGVALLLIFLFRAPRSQKAVLTDGSTLTLHEVSYGHSHRFLFGPLWRKLQALVPQALRRSAPGYVAIFTNREPFIAFRLSRHYIPGTPDTLHYYLEDSTGYAAGYESDSWSCRIGPASAGIAKAFHNWPRRDAVLRLGLYRRTADGNFERVGNFIVRNPAPRTYPVWEATAPPVSTKSGAYEFTLAQLRVGGAGQADEVKPSSDPSASRVRATFRARRDGRDSRSWAPVAISISDATGNTVEVGSYGLWSADGVHTMNFRSSLWPGEPWKMRVQFSRAANYSSNELIRFPPIPIPQELLSGPTTNTFAVNLSTNWQSVPLTAVAFEGRSRNSSGPGLYVRCGPLPADHRATLVSLQDDRKRNISGGGSTSDKGEYRYSLKLASNSATLHLTLAVHKSLFAEFVAQPARVTD